MKMMMREAMEGTTLKEAVEQITQGKLPLVKPPPPMNTVKFMPAVVAGPIQTVLNRVEEAARPAPTPIQTLPARPTLTVLQPTTTVAARPALTTFQTATNERNQLVETRTGVASAWSAARARMGAALTAAKEWARPARWSALWRDLPRERKLALAAVAAVSLLAAVAMLLRSRRNS